MTLSAPDGYAGRRFSASVESLLAVLKRFGFEVEATTKHAGKTVNLSRDGIRRGYINESVLQRDGVLGYHFAPWGNAANSCPPEQVDSLVPEFCQRYSCDEGDIVVHHGGGSNKGYTYLIIKNPTVALRVLLQDAGESADEDILLSKVNDRYVEGAVRDVVMSRQERSIAARQACLASYGYDCCVCGTNLRLRYFGLPREIIHVHHEEPISHFSGPHEVDPFADLKPVCPNCHAVIHSLSPPYSIAEVQRMLEIATDSPPPLDPSED